MTSPSFTYQGKYIQIEEQWLDGRLWEKAYFRPGIVIFPITDAGEILLVKEKRPHETPSFRMKPVTGIFEAEFSIEENARREMQEEIGQTSNNIQLFLELQSTGTVNNRQYFVYAKNLSPKKIPNPDGEDTIQEILKVTPEELSELTWKQQIPWGQTTLGILKLLRMLEKKEI